MFGNVSRLLCCLIFLSVSIAAGGNPDSESGVEGWVETTLANMSLEEKIGQLFMVTTYSNQEEKDYKYIESLIMRHKIGGLIFMQGNPVKQVELTNRYQSLSDIPLMISMDAEWGLSKSCCEDRPGPILAT